MAAACARAGDVVLLHDSAQGLRDLAATFQVLADWKTAGGVPALPYTWSVEDEGLEATARDLGRGVMGAPG